MSPWLGSPLNERFHVDIQETWSMLAPDTGAEMTAVAVGIARLAEPAVATAAAPGGGGFVASGRAASVAAGRLSFFYGLKVRLGQFGRPLVPGAWTIP